MILAISDGQRYARVDIDSAALLDTTGLGVIVQRLARELDATHPAATVSDVGDAVCVICGEPVFRIGGSMWAAVHVEAALRNHGAQVVPA